MRKIYLLFTLHLMSQFVLAQDDCSLALILCNGDSKPGSTIGTTFSVSDPALSCGDGVVNNSTWFKTIAINNGTCDLTVSGINNTPGLDMEIYTGSCGSLVSTGNCTTGSGSTGGTMSISFATVSGTTYYIMVDGNGGNQELFTIQANSANDAIIAKPNSTFGINPSSGCLSLLDSLTNITPLHGGSQITYQWKIDAGPYLSASGSDTTILLNTIGYHDIELKVSNAECGYTRSIQSITVLDLVPSFIYLPSAVCVGSPIFFTGISVIVPDSSIPANTSYWHWDFGDPSSGVNDTTSGQFPTHVFVGSGTTFNVKLVIDGYCGPDSVITPVTILAPPIVDAGPAQFICEGDDAHLLATVSNASPPITYQWSGPGIFSAPNSASTDLSFLSVGGPYTIGIDIVDSVGCVATASVNITVNPKPTLDTLAHQIVCQYGTINLLATPLTGIPPFTYLWSPGSIVSDSTLVNPTAVITGLTTFCVTTTDSTGCVSDASCVDIDIYAKPAVAPTSPVLCASQPLLADTFTVSGTGAGSTFTWILSTNYGMITGSNADSSNIYATFPSNIIATYFFTVVVADGVTGCIDTVSSSLDVINGLIVTATGPSQLCAGDSITLSAGGAMNFVWTASPAYTFSDSTLAVQTVSPAVNTIFTVLGTTFGCSGQASDTVKVNAVPVADASPIWSFCSCTNLTLDGTGSSPGMNYKWTSSAGSLITDDTLISATAFTCTNDTFTLLVTDPTSGCFIDTTVTAQSRPRPAASAFVTPTLICNGVQSFITLDGTGSDTNPSTVYYWSSTNPLSAILNPDSLVTSDSVSTATVYTLSVTDSTGCDSVLNMLVDIQPVPVLSVSNPFLCVTDPLLQSTLTVIGAAPGSTYSWDTIPACVTPNSTTNVSQNFDFTTCGAGVFNFDVTVTDIATTCVNTIFSTVTIVSTVVLTASTDTAYCEGGTATLYASGANSYNWVPIGLNTDTIVVPGLSAAGAPYTFTVTGTIGTCTASQNVNVDIHPLPPLAPISGPISVCTGDTGLSYMVAASSGFTSWNIVGGTITTGQNTDTITVDWNAAGTGTLTVTDTSSFGCVGIPQVLNVTINPLPVVTTIFGPTSVCELATNSYSVIANPGSIYTWAVTGGTINGTGIGNSVSVTWDIPGQGFLSMNEVNANNCIGPIITDTVFVNPAPLQPAVSGNSQICDSSIEIYTVPLNPGSTYNWFGPTLGTINPVNATGDSSTVTWHFPGNDTIGVTETSSANCTSDTTYFPVVVYTKPMASVLPDSAGICIGNPFPLTGAANLTSINWITSGSGSFSDSTIASPVYTPGPSDTGYVTLSMIVSNPPCADDTAVCVLYVSLSPVVAITAAHDSICIGLTDTLSATGTGSYLWTPGNDTNSTIIIQPNSTTDYTVTVTNIYSCSASDTIQIKVIPNGTVTATGDTLICVGDSVTLNGSYANAGGMQWSTLGDGTFSPNVTSASPAYFPGTNDTINGFATLILTSTGSNCQNLSDTIPVLIRRIPSVDAGRDTLIKTGPSEGATVPLSPTVINSNTGIWYSSGTGSFSPSDTTMNAIYTPSAADYSSGPILLVYTATGGCLLSIDSLHIEFTPFVVPNVFTPFPLSPGYNDYFEIKGLPPGSSLKIWSRWGLLVFSTNSYRNDWDGAQLIGDDYYYVLKLPNGKEYHGQVKILRQ